MPRVSMRLAELIALVCAAGLAPPACATDPLPVPYDFLVSAVASGADQSSSDAPGTNDWTCRPTRLHPRPVVLVHGTGGNRETNWQTYGPLLKNHGYCVFALTFGASPGAPARLQLFGGMARMQDSAGQLAAFVAKVRRATGARKVDIIGHSQGTLMPNYYVKFLGGHRFVKRYISLAPVWHGTATPVVKWSELAIAFGYPEDEVPICAACGQLRPGSAFLAKMSTGPVAVEGVQYTNIMTKYDELVVPYTSGRQAGMRNIVVQDRCATDYADHLEIAADPVAAQIVLNRLDPTHAQPLRCTVVLP